MMPSRIYLAGNNSSHGHAEVGTKDRLPRQNREDSLSLTAARPHRQPKDWQDSFVPHQYLIMRGYADKHLQASMAPQSAMSHNSSRRNTQPYAWQGRDLRTEIV